MSEGCRLVAGSLRGYASRHRLSAEAWPAARVVHPGSPTLIYLGSGSGAPVQRRERAPGYRAAGNSTSEGDWQAQWKISYEENPLATAPNESTGKLQPTIWLIRTSKPEGSEHCRKGFTCMPGVDVAARCLRTSSVRMVVARAFVLNSSPSWAAAASCAALTSSQAPTIAPSTPSNCPRAAPAATQHVSQAWLAGKLQFIV